MAGPASQLPGLRFQRPNFPSQAAIEAYFKSARDQAWYSNGGPCLEEFSRRLAARAGAPVLPLANATVALMLGVAALRRDELGTKVLLPSFTFPAVIEAVLWNGLEPVFLDISPGHLHLDPERLADALADPAQRVCLAIAGSSFGTPPPPAVRSGWESVCRSAGVPLLVDSAAGFAAAAEDGVAVGSQGDAEVVSFHITKPFGIGEGGAIFSRDSEMIEHVRSLSNFGFDAKRSVIMTHGTNAKLDELRAAVGLAVLDEIDGRIERRRASALHIIGALGHDFVPQVGHERGTYQFVSVLTPTPMRRERILRASKTVVQLRTYYEPLHRFPAFSGVSSYGDLAVTEDVAARILSLPMYDNMTEEEGLLVCDVVGKP
jgi:dTDP-4-amino-4,6-dideoxygalactose transaminase